VNWKSFAMSKSPNTPSAREKIVANTLGTLRIEKLSPSVGLKFGLEAYVNGHKTTAELLAELKSRNVTLRGG
jgi:hypothetical protein